MESWRLIASVKELPSSLGLEMNSTRVISREEFVPNVISESRANKIGIRHLVQSSNKYYVLERYGSGFWICYDVIEIDMQEVRDDFTGDEHWINWAALKEWNHMGLKDLLPLWKESATARSSTHQSIGLEMKPPGEDKFHGEVVKLDPATFLEAKYYDSLFNIYLPLVYFVKSTLSRLKNACNMTFGEGNAYLTTILQILMRIDEFDQRHVDGGLVVREMGIIAAEKRRACLNKLGFNMNRNGTNDDNENSGSLRELSGIFKIREIKLQVIILLEAIAYNQLDTNFENFENKYEFKLKKRSLNLTKRRALPMKSKLTRRKQVADMKASTSEQLDFCEQLDLYLDKLCILDILLASEPAVPEDENIDSIKEHKKNLLNKHKESSSVGFVNYVLIPYFAQRTPNAIKFTIQKLKGPSLKSRRPLERNVSEKSSSFIATIQEPGSRRSSTPSSPQSTTPSPWIRQSATNPEVFNTRTSSNLNSLFESGSSLFKKPTFLSRTKSDLTMNLMKKRQLSVTDLNSKDRSLAANDDTNNSERTKLITQNHRSFRRVGKLKNDRAAVDPKMSKRDSEAVQVMSTPLVKVSSGTPNKRAKLQNIVESPIDGGTGAPKQDSKNFQDPPILYGTPQQRNTHSQDSTTKPKKNIKRRLFAP